MAWQCSCGGIMDEVRFGYFKCRKCGTERQMVSVPDEDDESLSVYEAAEIWLSHGMDEDYMFGYTERELRRAAGI